MGVALSGIGWRWSRAQCWWNTQGLELDAEDKDGCFTKRALHEMREARRRQQWSSFIGQSRRGAQALQREFAAAPLRRMGFARYAYAELNTHQRAVLVGAANSKAVYERIKNNQQAEPERCLKDPLSLKIASRKFRLQSCAESKLVV